MNLQDSLLSKIKARQTKQAEFNSGILTADRYVRTLLDCVGSDVCYQYAAGKTESFDDILRKSANTLTYNNDEMVLEDIYGKPGEWKGGKEFEWVDADGDSLQLPKNTLMVFRHVLTTPKKDRDGDILRTQGAKPDPKMLLLWQHIHTLPIGKMLSVAEHNSKRLAIVSAIVDINAAAHDAAVMIDNGMGRFSHGFRALEFSQIKEGPSEDGGFDVKLFEIMEASVVSVPSNTDAEVEEVILSLVEGKKLTSPIMREVGKSIRGRVNKRVSVATDVKSLPISLDLNITVNGKSAGTGHVKCNGKPDCGCGCSGTSEKTDENQTQGQNPADKEMMLCPKCGAEMVDGKCTKCDYQAESGSSGESQQDADDKSFLVDVGNNDSQKSKTSKTSTKAVTAFIYPGSVSDSYESIGWSLREQARAFLKTAGFVRDNPAASNEPVPYTWVDVVATFDETVILSVENEDGRKYYRAGWKKFAIDDYRLTGVPVEVSLQVSTQILEKAISLSRLISKNCGTGSGGFQAGNTCARGSSGSGETADASESTTSAETTPVNREAAKRTFLEKFNAAYDVFASAVTDAMDNAIDIFSGIRAVTGEENVLQEKEIVCKLLLKSSAEDRQEIKRVLDALLAVDEMKSQTENITKMLG